MATVERDIGRRLEWAAVNHYDTEPPARARRRARRRPARSRGPVRPGATSRTACAGAPRSWRPRSSGPRSEREVQRAGAKEVTQERFTSLDRELERRAKDNVIAVRGPRAAPFREPADASVLFARLEHLEAMRPRRARLAPTSWMLADGWSERLKEIGTRGDIIKQMHLALRGRSVALPDRSARDRRSDPTPAEPRPRRPRPRGRQGALRRAGRERTTPSSRPLRARVPRAARRGAPPRRFASAIWSPWRPNRLAPRQSPPRPHRVTVSC